MARGMPRSRSTAMKPAQPSMASAGTGPRPLAKTACLTRLTSPIHRKRPGYSSSISSRPARTDSGSARSGKVMDSVRWRPSGVFTTALAALTKSFRKVGVTGVPGQSR